MSMREVLVAMGSMLAMAGASAMELRMDTTVPGTALQDLTLESLIAKAMTGSPLLAAKQSDVSAARHDVQAARWQYAPSVSTQFQKGSGSPDYYGSAVRADQPLYTGGRLDAELDSAASRRQSAALGVQETGQSVALQVVSAYQQLQTAQAQAGAIAAYRDRLTALSGTLDRRVDSGVSPAAEKSLMNARLVQAQNDLAASTAAEASAAAALRRLVGDDARVTPPPPAVAGAVLALPPICAGTVGGDTLVDSATDRSPAVLRATEDVETARHTVRGQRAALMPAVTLRVEQPVGHVVEGASKSTRVSVLLSYAPNAGLSSVSRASAGDDRVTSLRNQAQALRRDVGQQIRSECAEHVSVGQRAAGFLQARIFTGDVLSSYMRLFLAGKRGWLDVLNAAREDFENEQAGHQAAAAVRGSQYRLRLLSGEFDLGLATAVEPAERHPLLSALQGPKS
jgi:adhesin transport system outer membrane protein